MSTEGFYDWIVTGFLDGTVGNGRISIGNNETVGEFILSASGALTMYTDGRTSSLQVTSFEELVGEITLTFRETVSISNTQSVTITVLGKSN